MAAAPEAKYTEETVLWVKRHTPKLITFAISRPEAYRFAAGQFSRLGFPDGEGFVWRAYSVVSAEYADTLEYFAVLIPGGAMSEKFAAMKAGDTILLDKAATGFLLPERFPDGSELVMLCTGSGIAPFLSILEQPEIWQRFERSSSPIPSPTQTNSSSTHASPRCNSTPLWPNTPPASPLSPCSPAKQAAQLSTNACPSC